MAPTREPLEGSEGGARGFEGASPDITPLSRHARPRASLATCKTRIRAFSVNHAVSLATAATLVRSSGKPKLGLGGSGVLLRAVCSLRTAGGSLLTSIGIGIKALGGRSSIAVGAGWIWTSMATYLLGALVFSLGFAFPICMPTLR